MSRSAAALSRATGRGDGSVIGGWIGLMIDPDLLAHLAAGRADRARLRHQRQDHHHPAHRRRDGRPRPGRHQLPRRQHAHRAHLARWPRPASTPYAVLEVDEHYLAQVLTATKPRVVALLNLTRDQLDRAKEVAMMAAALARRPARHPDVHVVANADDPMVHLGAHRGRDATSPGSRPASAGTTTPGSARSAASHIERDDDAVVVHRLRPAPPRAAVDGRRTAGSSTRPAPTTRSQLQLPGRVNLGQRGHRARGRRRVRRPARDAVPRLGEVTSIAGRYATGRSGRPHHPAAAGEEPGRLAGGVRHGRRTRPTLLSINARDPDGLDTSWLFDVDFSPLRGRQVLITGDRA